MITDVLWADLNADGLDDIVIAGEWMPISIFINSSGTFENKTADFNLTNTSGIWSSVVAEDIDNDGDLDLVAGNVGSNSFYQKEDRLFVNDFDQNGKVEQLFTHKREHLYYPIVDRDELVGQMPSLKKHLLFYKDYAPAHMESIFNQNQLATAVIKDIHLIETSLFINTNGQFNSIPLPPEVQYSNTNSLLIYDVDNDGVKDIITGGNQYKVKPQFGISDASKGWLTKGAIVNGVFEFKGIQSLDISGQIRDFDLISFKEKSILITSINNDSIQFYEIQ
jgi:hypothetical protein